MSPSRTFCFPSKVDTISHGDPSVPLLVDFPSGATYHWDTNTESIPKSVFNRTIAAISLRVFLDLI